MKFLLFLFTVCELYAGSSRINKVDEFHKQIKKLSKKYLLPGVAVSIIDKTYFDHYCLGYSDLKNKNPVTSRTIFSLGSISKPISALGIMQLLKEKQITLDESIISYLDYKRELFTYPSQLSIRKTLNHTAGLKYYVCRGIPINKPYKESLFRQTLEEVSKLSNNPEEKFLYTASGYVLAQGLISSLSGVKIDSFFKKSLFSSLNMNYSSFWWDNRLDCSKGYSFYNFQLPPKNYIEQCAAGFNSNLLDMTNFIQGFWNGKIEEIIGTHFYQEICKQNANHYTLGFGVESIEGHIFLSHHGTNRGWNAYFGLFPKLKKGIVILTNSDRGLLFIDELHRSWKLNILGLSSGRNYSSIDFVIDLSISFVCIALLILCWNRKKPLSLSKRYRFLMIFLLISIGTVWMILFYSPYSFIPGFIMAAYLPLRFHLTTLFGAISLLLLTLKPTLRTLNGE